MFFITLTGFGIKKPSMFISFSEETEASIAISLAPPTSLTIHGTPELMASAIKFGHDLHNLSELQ